MGENGFCNRVVGGVELADRESKGIRDFCYIHDAREALTSSSLHRYTQET